MYTDPGTGSLLLQILLGIILAIPALLALFWTRVKTWFTNLKDRRK